MAFKEDLRSINALVKEMDSQLELLSDLNKTAITEVYELDYSVKDAIGRLTAEEIEGLTLEDLAAILDDVDGIYVAKLKAQHENNDEYKDKDFIEYAKYVLGSIKGSLDDMRKIEVEREKIQKEVAEISENYFNYVNSTEYKAKKLAKIKELKEKAETEEDETKKRGILRMISEMEAAEYLTFLTDRLEANPEKESKNITDVFFNPRRSEIVMNKFKARLPRFGYNPLIYHKFFNIEENFLPEEYHAFNNIFLFHVMRTISYMNADNKADNMYIGAILIKMYNLLYHKFENQDIENEFIDFIKKIVDYFVPYKDIFVEKNTTAPTHPIRIQADAENEQKRRIMIISHLQNMGIDVDTSLDTDELYKILQDAIDAEEEKKASASNEEADDTILDDVDENSADEVDSDVMTDIAEKAAIAEDTAVDDTNKEVNTNESTYNETESEIQETEQDSESGDENLSETSEEEPAEEVAGESDYEVVDEETGKESDEVEICDYFVEEALFDKFNCFYVLCHDGTYRYFDEHGVLIEKDISSDEILRLESVNAIVKRASAIVADSRDIIVD